MGAAHLALLTVLYLPNFKIRSSSHSVLSVVLVSTGRVGKYLGFTSGFTKISTEASEKSSLYSDRNFSLKWHYQN